MIKAWNGKYSVIVCTHHRYRSNQNTYILKKEKRKKKERGKREGLVVMRCFFDLVRVSHFMCLLMWGSGIWFDGAGQILQQADSTIASDSPEWISCPVVLTIMTNRKEWVQAKWACSPRGFQHDPRTNACRRLSLRRTLGKTGIGVTEVGTDSFTVAYVKNFHVELIRLHIGRDQ